MGGSSGTAAEGRYVRDEQSEKRQAARVIHAPAQPVQGEAGPRQSAIAARGDEPCDDGAMACVARRSGAQSTLLEPS
jgi:hypothetical protein